MDKGHILIVDDEKNILDSLEGILADEGYRVTTAENGSRALEIIRTEFPDLVLLDVWMPDMDGIKALKAIKEYRSDLGVIVMSGHGTVETAVKAIKLGALDYIEKPLSLENVLQRISQGIEQQKLTKEDVDTGKKALEEREIIGRSEGMEDVRRFIKEVPETEPVLIIGEKGTGKELIARIVHNRSRRKNKPFIELNCSELNRDEIAAALFGEKDPDNGSFSAGKIASAAGGTLLINEIFYMNLENQEKLFDFLKEKETERESEATSITDARMIATTGSDIEELLQKGEIHYGLLQLLSKNAIPVPSLRTRSQDIPLLVNHFLKELYDEKSPGIPKVDNNTMECLMNYSWPGNIKELKKVMERIAAQSSGERITLEDIPENIRESSLSISITYQGTPSMEETRDEWEREFIIYHLQKNDWDLQKTSQSTGFDEKSLSMKISSHQIVHDHYVKTNHVFQRTLKRSMVLCGKGLHSGLKSGLILLPLPPNSGIHFGKVTSEESVPAHVSYVDSADYATSLRKGNLVARTIEHIMAVLHMYRINNLLIKINDEVPIMDGSARDFCELLEDAGIEEQKELIEELVVDRKYSIGNEEEGSKFLSIEPADNLIVDYLLQYPPPVGRQRFVFEYKGEKSFKTDIAPARTFGFLKDIEKLEQMGLASGGRLNNFILVDDEKVVNTELRFPDEFVRHKILDVLGDFYLLGKFVKGKITAHMTGHKENLALIKKIEHIKL